MALFLRLYGNTVKSTVSEGVGVGVDNVGGDLREDKAWIGVWGQRS